MNDRTIRVRLRDPDDLVLADIKVRVESAYGQSDLDVRKQIAAQIDHEGRYCLYEEDSIFAVHSEPYDYWAMVQELLVFADRCPSCGDQSEDTRTHATNAIAEGGRGHCPQCGAAFKVARM